MTEELDLQRCLAVAKEAALAAGSIIKQAFHSTKQIEQKSSHVDLVTATDKQCESVICSILKQHFPQHQFIGEETAAEIGGQGELTDEPTWMVRRVDPACAAAAIVMPRNLCSSHTPGRLIDIVASPNDSISSLTADSRSIFSRKLSQVTVSVCRMVTNNNLHTQIYAMSCHQNYMAARCTTVSTASSTCISAQQQS